jgi:hypothetical protein
MADAAKEQENGRTEVKITFKREEKLILIGIFLLCLGAIFVYSTLRTVFASPIQSCKNIVYTVQRYQCLNALALEQHNASVCLAMNYPYNYTCVSAVAVSTASPQACALIKGSGSEYYDCILNLSLATATSSYCNNLNGQASSSCMYDIASANGFSDLAVCSAIVNATLEKKCTTSYDYRTALSTGNSGYCAAMPYGYQSAANYTGEQDLGDNENATGMEFFYVSDNGTLEGLCYYQLAVTEKNPALCAYVPSSFSTFCNEFSTPNNATDNATNGNFILNSTSAAIINATLEKELGENLTQNCTGIGCYYLNLTDYALIYNNTKYCLNTNNYSFQDSCIEDLVFVYHDADYCSYILNSSAQYYCKLSVNNTS